MMYEDCLMHSQKNNVVQETIFAAGYGSFCAWMIIAFHATGNPLSSNHGTMPFEPIAISFFSTLLICAIYGQKLEDFITDARVRTALVIILALSSAMAAFPIHDAQHGSMALRESLSVLSGICSAAFLEIWANAYSLLPTRSITVSNALSYFFNSIIVFAIAFFSPSIALLLSPCISLVLMNAGIAINGKHERASKPSSDASTVEKRDSAKMLDYRFFAFVLGSSIIFFCLEFMRYLYELTIRIPPQTQLQATGFVVIAAIVIGIAAVVLQGINKVRIEYLYRFSFIALIVSTLFFPLQMQQPSPGFLTLGYALSLISYQCFNILNFTTTVIAGKKRRSLIRITGIAQGLWAASCILGEKTASLFAMMNDPLDSHVTLMCSAVTIAALTFSFLFVFTEKIQIFMMRTPIFQGERSVENVCEELSVKHALSPRQKDVLLLLARGHNTSSIAEQLFISKSTVNTHRYHIYKKLGKGSQQELIDLIEEHKSNARGCGREYK